MFFEIGLLYFSRQCSKIFGAR